MEGDDEEEDEQEQEPVQKKPAVKRKPGMSQTTHVMPKPAAASPRREPPKAPRASSDRLKPGDHVNIFDPRVGAFEQHGDRNMTLIMDGYTASVRPRMDTMMRTSR
eukprot:5060819-Alexandrium_andersonii.AAC.1